MKTYYTVYQTTNHKTGHIYIGTHKTVDVHDSYLGSGTRLANAIRKYGHEFFSKEVLHIFENSEDMFLKEAELVDEEFVKRLDTYNIKTGGYGGWEYINQNRENLTYNWNTKGSSERFKKMHECGDFKYDNFLGKKHTKESKKKMSETSCGMGSGKNNSQYGSMWVTNGVDNRKIKANSTPPDGYTKGRTLKKRVKK